MLYDDTTPAMLNVFDGAWNVMLHSAASSDTVAKGMWRLPNNVMSQCISSLTTMMLWSWQKRASRVSVLRSQHIPAGLWGLLMRSMRHLASHTSSRFRKSML